MKLDTTDTIILTVGIIAILVSLLHIFFLWATHQPVDSGYDLPPTDLDGRDAQGSAFGKKGGSHE
jgi:hypothetical protein